MIETPTYRESKIPSNSFEAFHWILSGQGKKKSPNAKLVSLQLAYYWNMDGRGRCDPSMERLMADLGISDQGIRNAVKELEDIGEWVAVRSRGKIRTRYFPMFVRGAKTELLATIEEQRLLRLNTDKARKQKTAQKPSTVEANEPEPVDAETFIVEASVTEPSPDSPVQDEDPKVQTVRDAMLRDNYQAALVEKASPDYEWTVPLPQVGQVVDVLSPENLSLFLDHGNPGRIFVSGAEDIYDEEVPGRWVEKFGANYNSTFTYSHIQDVYDELIASDLKGTNRDRIDAAMFVLGSLSKAPSTQFLKALLFTPMDALDDAAQDIRQLIDATAAGRVETRKLSRKGHYLDRSRQAETDTPGPTTAVLPDTPSELPEGYIRGESGKVYSSSM